MITSGDATDIQVSEDQKSIDNLCAINGVIIIFQCSTGKILCSWQFPVSRGSR